MHERFFKVNIEHRAGETRQNNGVQSMCLGERSYGGGSGPIWATPGETAEFTAQGSRSKGYLIGECQAIFPQRKSVGMLILKGNSWGDFRSGNAIEINAEDIGRYRPIDPNDTFSLPDLAAGVREATYSNQVFKEITLQELEAAFTSEFTDTAKRFLGDKAYGHTEDILRAYLNFAQTLRNSNSDLLRQPSKKVMSSARRVRHLLGLEGSQMNTEVQNLIPTNLSSSQSAAYGAVIGALVGDAAGGVLEFLGRKPNRNDVDRALNMSGGGVFQLAPGQITDDGELTLCLLRALSERDGTYAPDVVASYYIDWANSSPFDIGMATSNALRVKGYEINKPSELVQEAANNSNMASKANGALMRITPLAVASARWSLEDTVKWARFDAKLTHPNETCLCANAAYVLTVRHLILHPGDSEGAIRVAWDYLEDTGNEAFTWLDEALQGHLPDAEHQAGFVRNGFSYAFFHLQQKSNLRQALGECLLRGGDTDTNACIVGGLIGAFRGVSKMLASEATSKLIYPVLMCDPSLGQSRPEVYHSSLLKEWMPRCAG